jgi:predicted nuclease of predicted toxin-antitoxin system
VKFLLDQDVYRLTERLLRDLGHDVVTAAEAGLARAGDPAVLAAAHTQGRILVTRDRHFGGLVFAHGHTAGVIYLRLTPTTLTAVHEHLRNVLEHHPQADLEAAFVVVEVAGYRLRRPPG